MTTDFAQPEIDFAALNEPVKLDLAALAAEHRAVLELVSHDWLYGDEDFATFVAVLMLCRTGEGQLIFQNDVRPRLLEDTVKGMRCSIEPHRFSSFYRRAQLEGLIAKATWPDGRNRFDETRNSPTRNDGKMERVYRWVGGAS